MKDISFIERVTQTCAYPTKDDEKMPANVFANKIFSYICIVLND